METPMPTLPPCPENDDDDEDALALSLTCGNCA
jgi:hypothetical protein